MRLIPALAAALLLGLQSAAQAAESGADKELEVFATEVAARIAELSSDKTPLPANVATLYDAMREIDTELAEYKLRTERLIRSAAPSVDLAATRRDMVDLIGSVEALDCRNAPAETVQGHVATLRKLLGAMAHVAVEQKLSGPGKLGPGGVDAKANCASLKDYLADAARQDSILQAFDDAEKEQAADERRREQFIVQVDKLTRLLQDRKWSIQSAISTKSSQQQLSGALWKVIAVIGLFGIVTILAVKLFDLKLQLEWVATGQVIQFVTVMILLSVLMALGLSGVLEQNTLGTLLGSVAGHVLAQGVGRAAAREAGKRADDGGAALPDGSAR
jgi:hypothetical protein